MLLAFALAALAGRHSHAQRNLLLAAVIVLLCNPLAVTGSGFWLSFGAVAALLWLAHWRKGRAGRGPSRRGAAGARLAGALATQGYMALVMLPLGALFFGGGSTLSLLANLVLIPLVGLVIVPLTLCGVACHLLGLAWAEAPWRVAAWLVEAVLPPARALAEGAAGPAWLELQGGALGIALALCALLLWPLPGGWPLRALCALLLLPLSLPPAQLPAGDARGLTVTVLDVGQGTAVLLRAGQRVLLYDTGGGVPGGGNLADSVVLPFLRRAGIRRLDTLVVSHGDLDHSAGVGTVLAALPVARVRRGGSVDTARGRSCRAGESWRWPGGQRFRFLSPAQERGLSENNASCVLQVQVGGQRLLLPGDIAAARERSLVRFWRGQLSADWLLVAHHGSATSTSRTLLKTVAPAVGVLSRGYANRFGHPHPDVLAALSQQGVARYDTAAAGALEFRLHPDGPLTVRAWREQRRRFWW